MSGAIESLWVSPDNRLPGFISPEILYAAHDQMWAGAELTNEVVACLMELLSVAGLIIGAKEFSLMAQSSADVFVQAAIVDELEGE